MDTDADTQTLVQTELYKSRMRLKKEMQRALACISPSSKRKLAAEWQKTYSELFYRELINCAKNKKVAMEIADWKVEGMK
jgi:hypothetical protein